MTAEQFRGALKVKPFKAFAIHTASGESYAVAHPEAVWQSPDGATVIVATGPNGACALMGVEHITEVIYPGKKTVRPSK
jgi:hypothetical protein